eukprot:m.207745 g.207745  ORF g.207745 m.207745 type:complete len:75 (+) comp39697_c1_seq13:1663-1887(+)
MLSVEYLKVKLVQYKTTVLLLPSTVPQCTDQGLIAILWLPTVKLRLQIEFFEQKGFLDELKAFRRIVYVVQLEV